MTQVKRNKSGVVVKTSLQVQEVWGLILESVKSDAVPPTTRHLWGVPSELCCSVAKQQRHTLPRVICFGIMLLE